MKPIEPTPREKAAVGNGDWDEWTEYEGEVNRDPAEYIGRGDPDPQYNLADNYATIEDIFLNQMERMWDDYKKSRIAAGNTADTKNGTDSTP